MCGIWGAVNNAEGTLADLAVKVMKHRGPDDNGVYVSSQGIPAALASVRLAIIDLSEAGHMPMSSEDGRYWIVYNGEVYNYQPIRQVLRELGHTFQSDTDTEVVLHSYMEWGERCLEHLRGMFAFGIWDETEGKLFAARDRLGIKPLYYTYGPNYGDKSQSKFAFSSEIKTLLATRLVEPKLNMAAVHHYLSFYAVPSPYTMIEGIKALPPAHYLILHGGELLINRYWEVPAVHPSDMDEHEAVVRLRDLLEESIRLRMIADVPVGAFLSGGIDSSVIVAMMTRASGERLKTFSVGFDGRGRSIDERSDAQVMADYYGTDHRDVVVTGEDVRNQLEDIIRALDQPSGDGFNTYLVSQAAAEHVKVALSGLGGDELFAGYPQFARFARFDQYTKTWKDLPGVVKSAARGAATIAGKSTVIDAWLEGGLLDRYERVRVLYTEEQKLNMYTREAVNRLAAPESSLGYLSDRHVHPAEKDSIVQLTRLEIQNYMAHTLLRDADAMSMAHSLEVRVPLIDHKLVEFAVTIPRSLKLNGGSGKRIFIKAVEDLLPAEVLTRPKRGFEMPFAAWMKHELSDVIADALSPQSIDRRGLFDPAKIQAEYKAFETGRAAYMRVWALVVLELWARQYIDQPITAK